MVSGCMSPDAGPSIGVNPASRNQHPESRSFARKFAAFAFACSVLLPSGLLYAASKSDVKPEVSIVQPVAGFATNQATLTVEVSFKSDANSTKSKPTGNVSLVAVLLDDTEITRQTNPPKVKADQRPRMRMRIPATTSPIPSTSTRLVRSRKKNTETAKVKTSSIWPSART